MMISRIRIRNFRSIRSLDLTLGKTTVFLGANNAGKASILDAVRIVLTRRWGQRGTGFTEHDVHCPSEKGDPKTLPPVTIEITVEEPSEGAWDPDLIAALEDIMAILPGGTNVITLRVTCGWDIEKESFEPVWEFLDSAGAPMTGKSQRATNLTGFFGYLPLFWLGALRDSADEFTPRSGHWGRLLKGARIPKELETEALGILEGLDARIVSADPKLAKIAKLIGQATRIAIGDGLGDARLNMLPLAVEDMLQRTQIVLRSEAVRPWLPLTHHGQGLQSLAVIFLFQAAVLQQLLEGERPGTEAVFAIEEPEAHLHPQAARTLWERIQALPGQKLLTTHSPYFVQHVPLHDLRLVRLKDGCTQVAALPACVVSDVPWNASMDGLVKTSAGKIFNRDVATGKIAAQSWFSLELCSRLLACYKSDPGGETTLDAIRTFHWQCRILPSAEDEEELQFHGRRVRGEIFFARRWVLVEGVTEYLLLHALGKAFDWQLDNHGVAVIDFQQSGSAGIYPALADAFDIPWDMIVDGDGESVKFRQQILNRGFGENDLANRMITLPPPNDLEDQLISDGHEPLLRDILAAISGKSALTCPQDEFVSRLKNKKTGYMSVLAPRVASDTALAAQMPAAFVSLLTRLRAGTA